MERLAKPPPKILYASPNRPLASKIWRPACSATGFDYETYPFHLVSDVLADTTLVGV
jgi:hypothetical protein